MRLILALSVSFPLQTLLAGASTTYNSIDPLPPLALTLLREADGSCTVASLTETQNHRLLSNYGDVVVETMPIQQPNGALEKLQLISHAAPNIWNKAKAICPNLATLVAQDDFSHKIRHNQLVLGPSTQPQLEVYPLVVSGSSRNRVDLTLFSDGYTLDEKDKFFTDAKRLALDMSQNQTFATVRPLINFWAAFSPSRETGIGVDGVPKDTAFGLYRNGTELRGVYCSKEDVAREACLSLGSRCDYPILLGNDPLYGGLGGEFTISTASQINGALVLRHELGHSMISIGEEYDGGSAYFGVNAAQDVSHSPFKWAHWLSSSLVPGAIPRVERAVMPFQRYPWTILNKTSPWSAVFESSGLYSRYLVRFSLSGLPLAQDLKVELDGKDLEWKPRPDVKLDRWHYDIYQPDPLARGLHELSFTLDNSAREGTAQLCSVEILEYGDESEFNSTLGYYGAFPTFSDKNMTTFRPTNENCLMRTVTSPSLCSVCLEGLWLSLLKRVSLIDKLTVTLPDKGESGSAIIELTLVPLGQMREHRVAGEYFTIMWQRDGISLPDYTNLTRITVEEPQGIWHVHVQLHTREVRVDSNGLLSEWANVKIENGNMPKPVVRG